MGMWEGGGHKCVWDIIYVHVKCTSCDHQCVNERIWSQLTKGSLGWKTDWNGGMEYGMATEFSKMSKNSS